MEIWSKLDFKRFGLKTAKLTITSNSQDYGKILNAFFEQDGDLFIIRCKAELNSVIFSLQNKQFVITDTMLTFVGNPFQIFDNKFDRQLATDVAVKLVSSTARDVIAEVAQKSFSQYQGHYHKNLFLDQAKCSDLYVDWAANMCVNNQMADAVFLAQIGDKPVGFASLKQVEADSAKAGLLGVLPEYRKAGIAQLLHQARLHWCRSHNINNLSIETGLNNLPYINLLQKLGFQLESSIYILHLNNH